jgi:hypothetical protein
MLGADRHISLFHLEETIVKKIFAAALLLAPIAFHPTFAATAQQEKMAACNKDATGMKGDERKAFMKSCLSKKSQADQAQSTQRDKMKTCNAEAKGKKGDERKAFMKECLKKD